MFLPVMRDLGTALFLGLPFLGFAVLAMWPRLSPRLAAGMAILLTLGSLVGLGLLWGVAPAGDVVVRWTWLAVGDVSLRVGVFLDSLARKMSLLVLLISLLVQVYSVEYMAGDKGFRRYFSYLCLFTWGMLGLVVAENLFQLYVFYELVGLSSFLLIGFWYTKPAPVAAARKAFVTTRIGDFALLWGILLLWRHHPSLSLSDFPSLDPGGWVTLAALLILLGAVGKSAQLPLHVWLPDAMVGPTPASALIHAATMVVAGVYLLLRVEPLLAAAPAVRLAVGYLGGVTAFLAATTALVQDDIKRVLAYSTISQLGYMFLGVGAAAPEAAFFHLSTHAFFKALLFLGAGQVMLALEHQQNLWRMGGLAKGLPWTAGAVLMGALALAGVFPWSGYWSKDAVLEAVWERGWWFLFWLGVLTAVVTALYATRWYGLIFLGRSRWGEEGRGVGYLRRPGATTTWPVVLLGALALLYGWVAVRWEGMMGYQAGKEAMTFLPLLTNGAALGGVLLGWGLYHGREKEPLQTLGPIYRLWTRGYFFDELYTLLGRYVVYGLASFLRGFDRRMVNGAVNLVAWLTAAAGEKGRRLQNGQVQVYGLTMLLSWLILMVLVGWLLG